MAAKQPPDPTHIIQEPTPPESDPPVDWNDRFALQVWMAFFLLVICFALLNYLVGFFRPGH